MKNKTLGKVIGLSKALLGPDLAKQVGKPRVLQFPINDICNSRCQMCDIWQQKKDYEISAEELRSIIKDPLYSDLTAVGMNGGEPTLRKDIGELAQVLVDELPKLNMIALITNGYSYKKVTQGIEAIGKACQSRSDRPVKLDVMVSIDGVGSVHDKVRGREGNFEYANKVIDYALESEYVTSVRTGMTVIRENVYDVENVLSWAKSKGVYARFRLGVPHQRLGSNDGRNAFQLTEEEKFHFCNFLDVLRLDYEPQAARKEFYLSLRNQLAYNMPRTSGCLFQTRGATLLPKGELAYCAVESKTLGEVKGGGSSSELYFGNVDHLKEIRRTKCDSCSHDYEGLPSREALRKRVVKNTLNKYGILNLVRPSRAKKREQRLAVTQELYKKRKPLQPVPKQSPNILLCGWYGTETLGDKAIIAGVIKLLRGTFDNPQFTIASIEPYVSENTRLQMPELTDSLTVSIKEGIQMINDHKFDAVFMAGGPIMTPVSECLEMAELLAHARAQGKVAGILGCGIGPLYNDRRDNVVKAIIEYSNVKILRDTKSLELCKKYGGSEQSFSAIDPAWWWLADQDSSFTRDQDTVVLALRDWPIKEYALTLGQAEAQALKDKFEEELIICCRTLISRGKKVIPLCMHKYGVGGDDRIFYDRLFKEVPEVLANLDMRHRLPAEDYYLFKKAGSALTMRFHSCVFALASDTPVVAIDYTRGGKIDALMKENDVADRLNSMEGFNGNQIANQLIEYATGNSDFYGANTKANHILGAAIAHLKDSIPIK